MKKKEKTNEKKRDVWDGAVPGGRGWHTPSAAKLVDVGRPAHCGSYTREKK